VQRGAGANAATSSQPTGSRAEEPLLQRFDYNIALESHTTHYSGLASRHGAALLGCGNNDKGRAQVVAALRLRIERENLLTAFDHAVAWQRVDLLKLGSRGLLRFLINTTSDFSRVAQCAGVLGSLAALIQNAELELLAQSFLTSVLRIQGQYEEAAKATLRSEQLARELGDVDGLATALRERGMAENNLGHTDLARQLLKEALMICESVTDTTGRSHCLNSLAILEYTDGNFALAKELLIETIQLKRKRGDRLGEMKSLGNLGVVEELLGDLHTARRIHLQVIEYERELGHMPERSASLHNLATVELELGNVERASELLGTALALNRDSGHRPWQVENLTVLGTIEQREGNSSEAREYYEEALSLSREIGRKKSEANLLELLAQLPA
jgi:tetratricopeptide (TPR) repeat protein